MTETKKTDSRTFILNKYQYALVRNNNTGEVSAPHEGPKRLQLESHEELVDGEVQDKVSADEGEYALVFNPFDAQTGQILQGERSIRIGPALFALHYGEVLDAVHAEHVLTENDALLLRAEREAPHPLDSKALLRAGAEVVLKGPCRFIPHKYIVVKEHRKALTLAEAEGVYVQNSDSGQVRLIRGPADVILEHNECFWDKRLTQEELEALGYAEQVVTKDSRVLAATPRQRDKPWKAVVLDLEHNECVCLFEGERTRVEFGPKTVFLAPNERPKVLFISGGVPVRPNVLRIAKLGLGPDFIRDQLIVRTKDNATLTLDVTYRWRFQIDEKQPGKLFALKDFIGFAAQALSSEIREKAAKHNFEEFHSRAAELVKEVIFGGQGLREFAENGLQIFGVDVEGIRPQDPEIQRKLADAIKTNVDIYTRRVQEEAQLESERRLIDGRKKNEQARKDLIELEIGNETAKAVAQAKARAEALRIEAEGQAEALTVRANAEREAEESRLKAVSTVLDSAGGKAYIELERARVLRETDKVVVPTDSKLVLGVGGAINWHGAADA